MRFVEHSEQWVGGIATRTTNGAETDPTTARIPTLWQRVAETDVDGRLRNAMAAPGLRYAVYTDYENDHAGAYTQIVGAAVTSVDSLPEGLVAVRIPAGHYMVFDAIGPLPGAVLAAWQEIWDFFGPQSTHRRTYTTDFERYDTDQKSGSITVSVFIACR